MPEWKFEDWLGWHEQGDGKLFLGVNIEQGRVRDYDATDFGTLQNVKMKSLVKKLVSQYHLTTVVTPSQSIIFKDIDPKDKADIDAIIKAHHVASAEAVDPLTRKSMACPALPLCGLAIAEAERRMPLWMQNMRQLMQRVGLTTADEIVLRMTGCPNGCARPYMAELALVGDGPESYQVWLGGEPNLTSLAWTYLNKVKWQDMDATIEPLLVYWKVNRKENESFGGFCNRIGSEELQRFTKSYQLQQSSLLTSTA